MKNAPGPWRRVRAECIELFMPREMHVVQCERQVGSRGGATRGEKEFPARERKHST